MLLKRATVGRLTLHCYFLKVEQLLNAKTLVNKAHLGKQGVERDLSSEVASSLLACILFLQALLFSFF